MIHVIHSVRLLGVALLAATVAMVGAGRLHAQDATPLAEAPSTAAGAVLHDTTGRVVGVALIATGATGTVTVYVAAHGLEPGEHGLHVHETGVCDPTGEKAFTSAGGHYNPTSAEHGQHAGDLGNITIDADGFGSVETATDAITLSELLDSDGAAVVVHANADANDAEGKSYGARSACGVLTTTAPQTPELATPTS